MFTLRFIFSASNVEDYNEMTILMFNTWTQIVYKLLFFGVLWIYNKLEWKCTKIEPMCRENIINVNLQVDC